LLNQISGARDDVVDKIGSSSVVRVELDAAIDHLRVALQMLKSGSSADDPKTRIGWAAARLKRAGDRFKSDSNK
jgi:hypothetical protein